MSTFECIELHQEKEVATLILNRPQKRNALNAKMIEELTEALHLLTKKPELRTLIIQGKGEHFCAGADIDGMQKIAKANEGENFQDAKKLADLISAFHTFPVPTIALIHGATLGGALGIICACDIVIASEQASFGFTEVKIGLIPAVISPYVLRAIGERATQYYFLTGARFNAQEAKSLGLIHELVKAENLLATGLAMAKSLNANAPCAIKAAKQLIREIVNQPINAMLIEKTAKKLADLRTTPEAQEGLLAFMEKRNPNWIG